jgi:NADPH-dependent curcumin reductase CurA
VYVGAAGMPGEPRYPIMISLRKIDDQQSNFISLLGQTAFMAWNEWSEVKKGETVFVTAAAGTSFHLVS